MAPLELTLIVAATRQMGIGLNGTMPWTGLRKEMAYFRRVTTRTHASSGSPLNAVIMGRKTWDSIPSQFRPLKDRLNIVITRSAPAQPPRDVLATEPVRVSTLDQALAYARGHDIARVFVIGGAQIYDMAAQKAKRVLLTRIERDFECDTFFPIKLEGTQSAGWAKKSRDDLRAWTGEDVEEDGQVENDTKYHFEMWEREE
ncbi:dihydrofolate reductase-like domain-containing protein [Emericellopsis atlantica]|uniref:Dihydrofolate reductase n=1 Tax=Emericellopsis atlantica TaxID=2614577 RepID=A0A9P7ZS57_9HYPO|nr:dihydrofolate reductase-like domain-containing protein [Emericellopsis atlantica]KAG9257304.1 dihydrofolate reductase-like domain-containing protein [Emericellopsis atlantica]